MCIPATKKRPQAPSGKSEKNHPVWANSHTNGLNGHNTLRDNHLENAEQFFLDLGRPIEYNTTIEVDGVLGG